MTTVLEPETTYVLGHSDREQRRLMAQATLFQPLTEELLSRAGLAPGMRVIDVGCGIGDVTQLVGWMVGPRGSVLGVDQSSACIEKARARAAARRQSNLSFIEADITTLCVNEQVDAIVGRLILEYLPNRVAALRRLASFLRPGGLLVFQEMDLLGGRSFPRSDLYDRCLKWITGTFARSNVELQMGLRLRETFVAAGLPAPQMLLGASVEGGPDSLIYDCVAQTVTVLLPAIEQFGLATRSEVDVETIADRLRDEFAASGGVIVAPPLVGAWTRRPN